MLKLKFKVFFIFFFFRTLLLLLFLSFKSYLLKSIFNIISLIYIFMPSFSIVVQRYNVILRRREMI